VTRRPVRTDASMIPSLREAGAVAFSRIRVEDETHVSPMEQEAVQQREGRSAAPSFVDAPAGRAAPQIRRESVGGPWLPDTARFHP